MRDGAQISKAFLSIGFGYGSVGWIGPFADRLRETHHPSGDFPPAHPAPAAMPTPPEPFSWDDGDGAFAGNPITHHKSTDGVAGCARGAN